MATHGKPETSDPDQGAQFAGETFTGVLSRIDIAISRDRKVDWRDNVFVELLWQSIKFEAVNLRTAGRVGKTRNSIIGHFDVYNQSRPHSNLDGRTPNQAYFTALPYGRLTPTDDPLTGADILSG